jgi:hypothetical protein
VFLKKLAQNVHRGLTGAVRDGKSGGGRSYGYRVPCYPDGARMVGKLEICEEEASVIRRIFEEYANGRSPLHIAGALNADSIPAPRHKKTNGGSGHWIQNAINGNKARGTGILKNCLYVASAFGIACSIGSTRSQGSEFHSSGRRRTGSSCPLRSCGSSPMNSGPP